MTFLDPLRLQAVVKQWPLQEPFRIFGYFVWLAVDANQAFTRESVDALMPAFVRAKVEVIEQPLPVGREAELEGYRSPIPLAADESVQQSSDIPGSVNRFNIVNIKLDKCGGLTEALEMVHMCHEHGLDIMVGVCPEHLWGS